MTEPKEPKDKNFTPVFDVLTAEIGTIGALIVGVIYRYSKMKNGVCYASKQTLAELTGLSKRTVQYKMIELIEQGWIIDTTPILKYRRHTYKVSDKARELIKTGVQNMRDGMQDVRAGMQQMHDRGATDAYKETIIKLLRNYEEKESAEFFTQDGLEKLLSSLIYVQKFKANLIDTLLEDKQFEYPNILERAVDTKLADCAYYAMDGRKVQPSDLINRENITELYYSSSMAYTQPGFYETLFDMDLSRGLNG